MSVQVLALLSSRVRYSVPFYSDTEPEQLHGMTPISLTAFYVNQVGKYK